ncbi:putative beta-lysine N-acetyltransferase [bacterium]|nr:putative beta-lysine N-acetyltransferase [bacterium]
MLELQHYLHEAFGTPKAINSKKTISMSIRFGQKDFESVFDPRNERVKLYGVTIADIQAQCSPPVSSANADLVFSKIIVYTTQGDDQAWQEIGFVKEGKINGFFKSHLDSVIWSFFLSDHRGQDDRAGEQNKIVTSVQSKPVIDPARIQNDFDVQIAKTEDAAGLSGLLKKIFSDYPSSLEPATIAQNIQNKDSLFLFVENEKNEMIACASAEIDHGRKTAELTDCATDPDYRGHGLMLVLLGELERVLKDVFGIVDYYTLCRAPIVGINAAFAKLGYGYGGRLVNNCRMPTGWESMNIWNKTIV